MIRRLLAATLAALLLIATFRAGQISAQPVNLYGVFLRDSDGSIWYTSGHVRSRVAIYPATQEEIDRIGIGPWWVTVSEDERLSWGPPPEWATLP